MLSILQILLIVSIGFCFYYMYKQKWVRVVLLCLLCLLLKGVVKEIKIDNCNRHLIHQHHSYEICEQIIDNSPILL